MGASNAFDNTFNFHSDDLSHLEIVENYATNNCSIRDRSELNKYYSKFILDENSKTIIICSVTFYRSSQTNKFIPRLTFKKTDKQGNTRTIPNDKPINIDFADSETAARFWSFIGFLGSFKELVDTDHFQQLYKVISKKDSYFIEFKNKSEKEKVEELKELILKSDIKESDIKSIVFENRKKTVKAFLYLIKNTPYKGKPSVEIYREKHSIPQGDEAIWHHFLKNNDWILGLNVDIKFISDFFDEAKIGNEKSDATGSPKSDLLGISNYTTLIELKHANTNIFKDKKSKARTNTWDFTSDFIEGVSQCLGQKFALDKNFESKNFVNENERLDKNKTLTIDPKTVFIIGCRNREFPHNNIEDNYVKSNSFELFRRNNRNIEIVTFDELFERAYHSVFSEKISQNWFEDTNFKID